jgi:hypothetical protein
MFDSLRKVERKDIDTEEELEIERLRHAPILGMDAWYACAWWAWWRMLTTQMLTRAGFWVFGSEITMFALVGVVLAKDKVTDGTMWLAYGAGCNCLLAWMWYCAPQQAKLIMEAVAFRIRGEKQSTPTEESK